MGAATIRMAASRRRCWRWAALLWVLIAVPGTAPAAGLELTLDANSFQVRAGGAVPVAGVDGNITAGSKVLSGSVTDAAGEPLAGLAAGADQTGSRIMLGASLTAAPGDYEAQVSIIDSTGAQRSALVDLTVLPPKRTSLPAIRAAGERPPVILLNGWQLSTDGSCPVSSGSAATFGTLEDRLRSTGAPEVYFFDNCVEGPGERIEDLGAALGEALNRIRDASGDAIPEFDLVAHSMGGLIARAYLAGLRSDGTLTPPPVTRVRKLVQIATPNFGSYLAANNVDSLAGQTQAMQMLPGSRFLWNLATWNQWGDDLRGVDALAVIGNGAFAREETPGAGASDGVVSLTSGALGFAWNREAARTRILPFCHITSSFILEFFMNCRGEGIAKAGATHDIVESFLAGTADWRSIGTGPTQDPFLSQFGGMFAADFTAAGDQLTDLTAASFGTADLLEGGDTGAVFYHELIAGTDTLHFQSASLGSLNCGPVEQPNGHFTAWRCKPSPVIFNVGPEIEESAARLLRPGALSLTGLGFGGGCLDCRVFAYPAADGSPREMALSIHSWTDQRISVELPDTYSGIVQLIVRTPAGADSINAMVISAAAADRPIITGVVNSASFVPGTAGNSWVTLTGSNLAQTSRLWDPHMDIIDGVLPSSLDNVRVSINGKKAVVYYISPAQINVLAPTDDTLGPVEVVVTNDLGSSEPFLAQLRTFAPGFFVFEQQAGRYAAATHADGSLLGPDGLFGGAAASRPAQPGETVVVYGTGFGPTTPEVIYYQLFSGAARLDEPVSVTVGGQPAMVLFAGMSGNGLNQLNIVVPDLPGGDHELAAEIGGEVTQSGVFLSVGP